ncbi:hypothetical protein JXI42_12280 [bacterium]|nr:hypothetical protein [bacterium]
MIQNNSHIIGSLNESSLHNEIKEWYAKPTDQLEGIVGNYIVDILRDDLIIEIQTANFAAIKTKLLNLLKEYKVKLVYPIPALKWIVNISPKTGESISRRRSPRRGKMTDMFDELLRIPKVFIKANFTFEVLFIEEEEIRCNDKMGSWRRKGVSIKDRKLLKVIETVQFSKKSDFIKLIPLELEKPFTNKTLAKALNISIYQVRRMTYALKKIGTIKETGKKGRELLYDINL